MAHGKKTEKVVQFFAFSLVNTGPALTLRQVWDQVLCDGATNLLDRALNHALVVCDAVMDVLVGEMAVYFHAHVTLLELHLVLRQRPRLVTEDELDLSKLLDEITVAA